MVLGTIYLCAINSGNSGGALFNLYGEVIDVTNAKYSGSSGSSASIDNIGFAIPINSILDIVESIIEKGYISKPYIGISVLDVSEETQQYGIPAGAAVESVAENSPAAQAGLLRGDVITAVDGKTMSSAELVSQWCSAYTDREKIWRSPSMWESRSSPPWSRRSSSPSKLIQETSPGADPDSDK